MSEIPSNQPDSSQEMQRDEADIAASLSAGAQALDTRAVTNHIPEIDTDSLEGRELVGRLPDGLHRSRSYAKHAMFIIKGGAKTHEILFRDSMGATSREQAIATKPEVVLSKFTEDMSSDTNQDDDQQIIFKGTEIAVNSDELISAKSSYSIRDGKNWHGDSSPLSREQTISDSADVLTAIALALEERINSLSQD